MRFRARGVVRGEAGVCGLVPGLLGCVVVAQLVGCGAPGDGVGEDAPTIGADGGTTIGVTTTPAASASASATAATSATPPSSSTAAPSPTATATGTASPPDSDAPDASVASDASVTTGSSDAGPSHGVDDPTLGDDEDATVPDPPATDDAGAPGLDAGTGIVLTVDAALPPVVDAGLPIVLPPVLAPPKAIFASATIDLSRADCGGAAVTADLKVTNGGAQTLSIGAATSAQGNGPFSVSPSRVDIAPGASSTLTVSAAVTAQALAGVALSGSLALTTNDPDAPQASVPLSVTPFGATLAWATGGAANFGLAHLAQLDAPIGLSLVNRGNAPASVFVGSPSDPQFTLAPAGAVAVGAGATLPLTADFLPALLGAVAATVPVTVSGPVCGAPLAPLTLSGSGGAGAISGWPTGLLDFGANPCGGLAGATQSFTLSNTGAFDVHLTGAIFSGGLGYLTDGAPGATIPAGGQLTVHVTPPSIPFPSPVPGLFADTLSITTDEPGDPVHLVSVTQAALGAILSLDTSANASFGAFGGIPLLASTLQGFTVRNTGNAPSTVSLAVGAGTPFSLATPSFILPAGGAQADAVSFAPVLMGAASSALSLAGTVLCQPPPAALPLVGVGQKGGLSLSLQSLSFAASCGSQAAPQSLSVSNTGNTVVHWTASLGRGLGALYSVSPASGTINPGDPPTLLTVTASAIAQYPAVLDPSAFADSLTVTTDVAGDAPHLVSLAETALGDVLSWSTGALDFGAVPLGTVSASQSFTLTNHASAGSAAANVSLASTSALAFPLSFTSAQIAAQSVSSELPVSFVPGAVAGILGGAIDIATTDPLCAPLPAPLTVSGTGTIAKVIASVTSLAFGQVNCGSTAGAQTVVLSNAGDADFHVLGAALSLGAFYTVSMSPANGTVKARGASTVTITVTPLGIPSVVPSVPALGTYSDSLTLTTDAAGDVPRVIPLSMGARGVIVDNDLSTSSWGFGSVSLGQVGTFSTSLHNAGNAPVSIAVSGLAGTVFSLASNPVLEASAPGYATLSASFAPSVLTGLISATASLHVAPAAGAVLCQPLPRSWTDPVLSLVGDALSLPGLLVPSALSFAPVVCGGLTTGSQALTVTNLAGVSTSFTASLEKGTYYKLSASTGSVAGLGATTLTVTSNLPSSGAGVLPGSAAYADRVVLTANGTTYYVPLTSTLEGAVLSVSATGTVNVKGVTGTSMTLSNSGNLVALAVPTLGSTSFLATPALETLLAGASGSATVSYLGTSSCLLGKSQSTTLSFTAAGLCQPARVVSLVGCQ